MLGLGSEYGLKRVRMSLLSALGVALVAAAVRRAESRSDSILHGYTACATPSVISSMSLCHESANIACDRCPKDSFEPSRGQTSLRVAFRSYWFAA